MTTTAKQEKHECGVCHRHLPARQLVPVALVRPDIAERLDAAAPNWRDTGHVCLEDVQKARVAMVEEMIRRERGELTELDHSVIASLATHQPLSANVEEAYDDRVSFGDRLADRMAGFAGSWTFIIGFGVVLVLWMAVNVFASFVKPFDPFPFILLNLVLSCIAAMQAPLIMMSQRRVEAKDRLRSENDYQVNLKAELEIRSLHEKLDHHLARQWERLSRIQEIQLELLDDMISRRKG